VTWNGSAWVTPTTGPTHVVGTGDATGTVGAGTLRGASASGTNIAGGSVTIQPGNGTGTGGSGTLTFQTAPVGSTGSTANTMATRLTIAPDGTATFARRVNITPSPVTDAASIASDGALSNTFTVTLAGNRTLANPTNLVNGVDYKWVIRQDATGSRTLAYGTAFKFPNGTAPTLTTTANAVDILTGYTDGTNVYCNLTKDFK
jgi:hypothetical protein